MCYCLRYLGALCFIFRVVVSSAHKTLVAWFLQLANARIMLTSTFSELWLDHTKDFSMACTQTVLAEHGFLSVRLNGKQKSSKPYSA